MQQLMVPAQQRWWVSPAAHDASCSGRVAVSANSMQMPDANTLLWAVLLGVPAAVC